ncbi:MAG: hypothetical protein N2449_00365 [Bacteroidales bacterium]|nr:hypothetical protein [Bacteroidales bacterium]
MNNITKIILLLLLFQNFYSFTQKTRITVSNITYAGETLPILKEKDFITQLYDTISFLKFDQNGKAMADVPCNFPYLLSIPMYKYQVWFCIEPNKQYQINVPNKRNLTLEDSLTAYFKPIELFAPTVPYDSSVTQNAIIELNYAIDTLLNKHLKIFRYKIKRKTIDSLLNVIENSFLYCQSKYFKDYLFFKIGWLRHFSYERDVNFIIKKYFSEKPVRINNLAYTEWFNEIFYDYLSMYATTAWGENVYSSIAKAKSPTELRKDLRRNPAFTNDTLIDLVILKGLHDAYFTNNLPNKIKFPIAQLKLTIDSMTLVACTPELKQIAKNIRQKINNEETVFIFEDFALNDFDGNEYFLRNFAGKFLYVNICDFRSYSFLIDQKKIKALLSRFSDKLTVIHIVLYPKKESLKRIIQTEQLHGIFLTTDKPELLKKQLRINALPHFIIYTPNGKILNASAPPPEESMIMYFMEMMK